MPVEFIKGGMRRAVHVFTPALQHRIKEKEPVPVTAIRCASTGYTEMKLYERVAIDGPSVIEPIFDNPLPGTGGRGVAIMFTEADIYAEYVLPPRPIDTSGDRKPEDIMAEVLKDLRATAQAKEPGLFFSHPTVGGQMTNELRNAFVAGLEAFTAALKAQLPGPNLVVAANQAAPVPAQVAAQPAPMQAVTTTFTPGLAVTLHGVRQGEGTILAYRGSLDDNTVRGNGNNAEKAEEMISERDDQPFPQLVVHAAGKLIHYNGDDLRAGKVRVVQRRVMAHDC